ncbi:unannotated protein [freshwater metagenome]|uniref:Unannotated protein n=1 Tax=freshwater metagenome TaxID=449393 RepID=A0A6J6GDN1_9ZZZZ
MAHGADRRRGRPRGRSARGTGPCPALDGHSRRVHPRHSHLHPATRQLEHARRASRTSHPIAGPIVTSRVVDADGGHGRASSAGWRVPNGGHRDFRNQFTFRMGMVHQCVGRTFARESGARSPRRPRHVTEHSGSGAQLVSRGAQIAIVQFPTSSNLRAGDRPQPPHGRHRESIAPFHRPVREWLESTGHIGVDRRRRGREALRRRVGPMANQPSLGRPRAE